MPVESLGTTGIVVLVVSVLYPAVPVSGTMPVLPAGTYRHHRETTTVFHSASHLGLGLVRVGRAGLRHDFRSAWRHATIGVVEKLHSSPTTQNLFRNHFNTAAPWPSYRKNIILPGFHGTRYNENGANVFQRYTGRILRGRNDPVIENCFTSTTPKALKRYLVFLYRSTCPSFFFLLVHSIP